MNKRIEAYLKTLEFIRSHPFEESIAGLSRQDALTLIQNFLDQHFPRQKINLLRYSDLLSSGKNILTDSVRFSTQIGLAINQLTPLLNLPEDQTTISFANSTLPAADINRIVEAWENEVNDSFKNISPMSKRAFLPTSTARASPFRKKWEKQVVYTETYKDSKGKEHKIEHLAGETLAKELLQERSFQVQREIVSQRQNRIYEIKTKLGTELTEQLSLATEDQPRELLDNIAKIHQIIVDTVDLNEDVSQEEKFWEDTSFSIYKPLQRQAIGSLTPEQREEKIKEVYEKKVQEKLAASGDPLSQDTDFIKQVVALIPGEYLTEQSYLKFVDKKLNQQGRDIFEIREDIGGLLFGKLTLEAERAVSGIQLRPKQRQKMGDAVAEAFFEIQAKGLNVANMSSDEINKILYDKLDKNLRTAVVRRGSNEFDISQEAKQIAVFEAQIAAAKGDTEELHALPIPGMIFLDKISRRMIVEDKTLYNALKTRTVDETLQTFPKLKLEELQNKLNAGKKLSKNEEGLYKELKNNLKNISSENLLPFLFGLEPTSDTHKFSKEEMLLVKRYLQGYQQVLQKHKTIGWMVNWNARLYSMNPVFSVGKFSLPKIQAWMVFKQTLSLSFSDPTLFPLASTILTWNLVKGTVGYTIKNEIYIKGINKIFNTIPSLNRVGFFFFFFFVKEPGQYIVTWLHPVHAVKSLLEEGGKKLLQKTLNKTVQWGTRLIGKEAMEKVLAKLASSALGRLIVGGGIPVIGQILNLLGFLWDFVFPEWFKRLIKIAVGLTIAFLLWILSFIIGLVGPLALLGMVAGLIFGGFSGFLIGGAIGFLAQTGLWILTGNVMWLPAWLHGAANAIGGFFTGLWNGLTGAGKMAAPAALSGPMISSGAWMAIASTGTAAAGGLVSVMMITTTVWTPIGPSAVPGGMIAQDFQVRKFVQSVPLGTNSPTDDCRYVTKNEEDMSYPLTTECKNKVAEKTNSTVFEYVVLIKANSGKTLSNITIKDEISVVAQGPCPDLKEPGDKANCPKGQKPNKYTISPPDIQAQVDGKTVPDELGNNTLEIKYRIDFHDEKYMNSAVFNLVKVTANGQTASNGTVFTIGTPPPSDCPVKQGIINAGSLGGTDSKGQPWEWQHGSNKYWDFVGSKCAYPIPALTQTRGNSISYPNATYCSSRQPAREDYGFAADIGPRNQMVFFPTIYGEPLSWSLDGDIEQGNPNKDNPTDGWGGIFSAEGQDYSYKMYLTHLSPGFAHSGQSGQAIGTMFPDTPGGSHVHVELERKPNNSTQWETLRPEFLCLY